MIFINDSDREAFLTGVMLTRILIQIQARDAENEIENVRNTKVNDSVDYDMKREAWSVARTCPIGFGSFSPRRNLLMDFEKNIISKSDIVFSAFDLNKLDTDLNSHAGRLIYCVRWRVVSEKTF